MARIATEGRRGQALVMVTLSVLPIFGLLGLVVDFGWAEWRREACQTAAESAATAAAVDAKATSIFTVQADTVCPVSPDSTKPLQAGCLYATQNGFTNGSKSQTVSIAGGTTALGTLTPAYWATATVSEGMPTLFSRVLGQAGMTVRAVATAAVYTNTGACVYVMDPNASKAFDDTGGSFTLGCGIAINSGASDALNTTAHNAITINNGAGVIVVGQWKDSTGHDAFTFNGGGSVKPNQPSFSNPVSGLPVLTPAGACTADPNVSGAHAALSPGTYCKLSISNTGGGASALTLNPGLYIINGDFKVSGGIVNASGVTLYFPTTGVFNVTGGTFNQTAPVGTNPDGTDTDGIAVWEVGKNLTGGVTGGTATMTGLIYTPGDELDLTGGGSSFGAIVAGTMKVTGGSISGTVTSKYYSSGGVPAGVYLLPNN